MGFLEDGLRYLPRSWLAMIPCFLISSFLSAIVFLAIMVLAALAVLAALVLGGFGASAVGSGQQALPALFLFLPIMFLVLVIFFIAFAPFLVMLIAGIFQDGLRGISRGRAAAIACHWPLLGIILMIPLIGLVTYALLLLFGAGAVAFDWHSLANNPADLVPVLAAFAAQSLLFEGVLNVMMVAFPAFWLTVFLIFYRRAVYSRPARAIRNPAPQLPVSAP